MSKMRTMTHNSRTNSSGRVHGNKHNDRNFDVSRADNINAEKSKFNDYINYYEDPNMTFAEVELRFYQEHFADQLEQTNQKYIKQRHPERCKTMEQFMKTRQYAPEETTYQIGKMEKHVDVDTLVACYNDFISRLNDWSDLHGNPFVILNGAVHADEAVPHIQIRRVWLYEDQDGVTRIGQEKALMAAGVELPDPNKKESRYNNRKKAFDAMARTMWLDVCEEHGLDIERTPVPNGKHNREKEEMIRDKYEEMLVETEKMEQYIAGLEQEEEKLTQNKTEIKGEIFALQQERNELQKANQELKSEILPEIERAKAEVRAIKQEEPETFEIPTEKLAVINMAVRMFQDVYERVYSYCVNMLEKRRNIAQKRKEELLGVQKEKVSDLDKHLDSIRARISKEKDEQPAVPPTRRSEPDRDDR